MPSQDLTKLWTELTKIGQIFSKWSTLKIKVFKKFQNISWSLNQIFFTEFYFGKIRPILDTEKWLWKYEFCNLWQGCS